MKLLFIQGGTRLKKDEYENYYTDGNLNNKVWNRYKELCDELLIVLRSEKNIYKKELAQKKFNSLDTDKTQIYELDDLMRPKWKFFSIKHRKCVKKQIEQAIRECDKAIIRSAHNFYTLNAIKYCKKHKKPYLIEVAGYAFDGYWGHGDLYGKIVAIPYEVLAKKSMRNAQYCVYVTNYSLQKNYPCPNNALGCSDVEINNIDENDLLNKLEKFKSMKSNDKIVLGTIGWVNMKLKGQHDVIKVLGKLKAKGINNFKYQLVGLGDHKYLDTLIEKLNLKENVKILGPKPHNEVFDWLEEIDVYIQPSYQEGLCRAVVEAMSKACPIIVSNAGGNPELANKKFVFKKGNHKQLEKILLSLNSNVLIEESQRSFNESKKYQKDRLDKIRKDFYNKFLEGSM